MLQKDGLENRLKALPSQLSGGEKQRVARALINDPKYLICDEPTGNLDIENRDKIIELLQTVNKEGTSTILVTHDIELMSLGNEKLILRYAKGMV